MLSLIIVIGVAGLHSFLPLERTGLGRPSVKVKNMVADLIPDSRMPINIIAKTNSPLSLEGHKYLLTKG